MSAAWTQDQREAIAAEIARLDAIEVWFFDERARIEYAVQAAIDAYAIDFIDLVSRRRQAPLIHARAMVVWALRTIGGETSYPAIGRVLARDHSSIIHLHGKAIALRLGDERFAAACDRLLAAAAAKGMQP